MKFKYIGAEPSDVFGLKWVHGVTHEVEDGHAIRKLSGNPFFMAAVDGANPEPPKPEAQVLPMKKARKAKPNGDDTNAG